MTALAGNPVFVDVGGYRARRVRHAGLVVGALALAYVMLVVVGVVGPPGSPFGFGLFGEHAPVPPAVTTLSATPASTASVNPLARSWPGWGWHRPAVAAAATVPAAADATSTRQAHGSVSDHGDASGTPASPGRSADAPGQQKTPPGQVKTPPGQLKTAPGQADPPGQSKTPPGQSNGNGNGNANGHGNGNGGSSAQHSPQH